MSCLEPPPTPPPPPRYSAPSPRRSAAPSPSRSSAPATERAAGWPRWRPRASRCAFPRPTPPASRLARPSERVAAGRGGGRLGPAIRPCALFRVASSLEQSAPLLPATRPVGPALPAECCGRQPNTDKQTTQTHTEETCTHAHAPPLSSSVGNQAFAEAFSLLVGQSLRVEHAGDPLTGVLLVWLPGPVSGCLGAALRRRRARAPCSPASRLHCNWPPAASAAHCLLHDASRALVPTAPARPPTLHSPGPSFAPCAPLIPLAPNRPLAPLSRPSSAPLPPRLPTHEQLSLAPPPGPSQPPSTCPWAWRRRRAATPGPATP
jgi:hypothetical protein